MLTDLDCALRKLKILAAFAGLVKSSGAPFAESFAHTAGMIPMSMTSHVRNVGLTGLLRLTTSVLALGVDMLAIVSGK